MSNAKTTQTKICTLMQSGAFDRGFSDRIRGKPFAYDIYPSNQDQWHYERGRQFGAVYTGPLYRGAEVASEALIAFADHLTRDGII